MTTYNNNKLKEVVIGDIHGHYNLLAPLLEKLGHEYFFIFLGDYIDRGPQSKEVIDLILSLPNKVCIKGNHEELFIDFLKAERTKNGQFVNKKLQSSFDAWLKTSNGGKKTLKSFQLNLDSNWNDLESSYQDFFSNLLDYYETDNAIFVHAGIDPEIKEMQKQQASILRWTRSSWLYSRQNWKGKIVYFGHTITSNYPHITNKYSILDSGKTLGLDTGSYDTGILTAIILQKGKAQRICKSIHGKVDCRDYQPD